MDEPSLLGPSVASLIGSGAIEAPVTVRGDWHGKTIEAELQMDGTFVFQKQTYSSPSVAAGHAITATSGVTTPGRAYASVNGWKFWNVRGADGQWRSLKEIRDGIPS